MRAITKLSLMGLVAAGLYSHSALAAVQINRLPFVADQAGETYVLSGNLTSSSGRAITIAADDVVIDGAGHTITYANSGEGNAVYVDYPVTQLEVKNLTMNQGNYEPTGGQNVHAVVVRGNHRGLNIHDNTININHGGAYSGAYGWAMTFTGNSSRSWGNRIAYNNINVRTTSAGYGLYIDPSARWQGRIHGNVIKMYDMTRDPAGYGRAMAISGRGPIEIYDNTIDLDASIWQVQAISLWGGSGHIIRNNTINAASYKTRAILIDGNSDDNLVFSNKIRMNNKNSGSEASAAIRIRYGSDNTVVYQNDVDTTEGNYTFGLRVGDDGGYGVPRGTVVRDNVFRSKDRAISVESGSDVVFYNNIAETTGPEWTYALYVYGSSNLSFNHDKFTGSVRLNDGTSNVNFCATGLQGSDINGSGYTLSSGNCPYPVRNIPGSPGTLSSN